MSSKPEGPRTGAPNALSDDQLDSAEGGTFTAAAPLGSEIVQMGGKSITYIDPYRDAVTGFQDGDDLFLRKRPGR